MQRGLEIVYWHGVVPGQYLPFFPVRVVHDDPSAQIFSLDLTGLAATTLHEVTADAPSRRYRSALVNVRMHQATFRAMVLRAYAGACSVCRLRRAELVDAAHIVTDAQGGGPVVLQGFHRAPLANIPRQRADRPGSTFLERRWEDFRAAS